MKTSLLVLPMLLLAASAGRRATKRVEPVKPEPEAIEPASEALSKARVADQGRTTVD